MAAAEIRPERFYRGAIDHATPRTVGEYTVGVEEAVTVRHVCVVCYRARMHLVKHAQVLKPRLIVAIEKREKERD